ncbi:MAG TPA: hypothetical protein VIJ00_10220, partial [Nakamurella sp.]
DGDGNRLQITASPADLQLSPLTVGPLVAGGPGVLTLDVSNPSGTATAPELITVTGPDGVTASRIDLGDTTLCAGEAVAGCTLPGLPAGSDPQQLTITLDVTPATKKGRVTVDIGGLKSFADVTVGQGVAPLRANPGGPLVADGQPGTLGITVDLQNGATTAGPITFTSGSPNVTFPAFASCDPPIGPTITCTGGRFDLIVTVAAGQEPGDLPITASDAGGRPLDLTDANSKKIQVVAPAELVLSDPTTVQDPVAGGTGAFSITVRNTGQQDSTPQPITVTVPDGSGVALTSITVSGSSTCLPGGGNAVAAPDCTLPVVKPGEQVVLGFQVTLPARATQLTATVGVGIAEKTVRLPVIGAITELRTDTADPLVAGSPNRLVLTATLVKGVTNPGALTFTSTSEAVRFAGSASCTGRPDGQQQITCTLDGTSAQVALIIAKDQPAGELPVTVTDEAGRKVPLYDLSGKPIQIVPPSAVLELSTATIAEAGVAGGTGAFSMTVTNTGGQDSTKQLIRVTLPKGATVGSITISGSTTCLPTDPAECVLPPVKTGAPVILGFSVNLPAATPAAANITVDIAGAEQPVSLPVDSGIASVTAADKDPLAAGRTTLLTVTSTPREGISTPGQVTFTSTSDQVTFAKNAACTPAGGGSTVVCDAGTVTLPINVTTKQQAGELPVVVTDAGGRVLPLRDAAGKAIQVSAAAARLELGELTVSRQPVAGDVGALQLTVTNSGTLASGQPSIDTKLDGGFTLQLVSVGDQRGWCLPTSPCVLPVIQPGESAALQFLVSVDQKAVDGDASVTIEGTTRTARLIIRSPGIDRDLLAVLTEPGAEPVPGPTATGILALPSPVNAVTPEPTPRTAADSGTTPPSAGEPASTTTTATTTTTA